MAYRGIDIRGGCIEPNGRFVGEYFMNRPIVDKNMLKLHEDIVIIPDYKAKHEIQAELPEIEVLYRNEILDLDCELKHKRVILYGAGDRGKEIYKLFSIKGIEIECVCVTNKSQNIWNGQKVYSIDELELQSDMAIVVAVKKDKYKNEILEKIQKFNI